MSNDIFIAQALRDVKPDATVVELKQLAINYEKWYNAGLIDAARKAETWADEAEANGGNGGMGYRNLASVIRDMKRKV